MPNKIEDFKEYARKRIVEKLREEQNSSKIESYDKPDSEYKGTDEEYEDFLENLDEKPEKEPSPVENTRRIGDPLGLHVMMNKVKEKAAESFRPSADDTSEEDVTRFEKAEPERSDDVLENPPEEKKVPEYGSITQQLNTVMDNLSDVRSGLKTLELKQNDSQLKADSENIIIKDSLDKLAEMTLQIKSTVASVSKLNDSIFDFKNSQQNVKVAVSDVSADFKRLKSKCTAGFTICGLIGLILIALEVINLLS